MDHSTYLYVIDPRGKFVRAFDTDTSGDRIADALRELMRKDVVKERKGVMATRESTDQGVAQK